VNWVDVALLALLVIAGVWGGYTGLVSQLFIFVGLVLGLGAGGAAALWVGDRIVDQDVRAAAAIATILGVMGVFYLAGAAIARAFRRGARGHWSRGVDAFLGTLTAMAGVAIAAWLLTIPVASSPYPSLAQSVRASTAMKIVRSSPPPPGLLASFRDAVKASGFPIVFEELPTPFSGPSSAPDPSIAGAPAVAQARGSTLKILAEACRNGSEGTGWVFAPEHLATNAHVVAGADKPLEIVVPDGGTRKGTVVAFDPDRDVAVVHVPGLRRDPLPRTAEVAPRDLSVAALGYPSNGPYNVSPGRVSRRLEAKGRDIYDAKIVDRNIYEVRTRIRPGNSGGPLVGEDGRVYGMVFAASTTDSDIGYVLTEAMIAPILDPAVGARSPVDTGPCLR
jgi:S1-C subfamily serine protease